MSIAKPFTFTANTYAKASEVNADFDIVYSQVNTNISAIAQNATDIDNLENNKANINGSSSERFAVANPIANADAVNKQSMMSAIGNSIDYIGGLTITKDSGSPDDTIIVSAGSCYDSTHAVVLSLSSSTSKQNLNQGANTTYYVYIIGNSTGSLIDILISTSSTTPALPTGYSLFRQIGSYTTDSNGNIDTISYYGVSETEDRNPNAIINGCIPNYNAGVTIYVSNSTDYKIPVNCLLGIHDPNFASGEHRLIVNGASVYILNGLNEPSRTTIFLPIAKDSLIHFDRQGTYCDYYPLKGV